jgi:hypothetical protein
MLDVFFTVDVEIWCGGWRDIDARFPRAFQQYVYGKTPQGEYALRYKLKQLQDHGLHGVFFVEPLFATRFGLAPLAEIIGLIQEHGQEVQEHLHTEWVCESLEPLIENASPRRQFLRQFSLEEQTTLIGAGMQLIERAGGGKINAFRAGSFGFNRDTLGALAANNIVFDSSYNASMFGPDSGVTPGRLVFDAIECDRVMEYPMTVFDDGTSKLRHVQLGACSSREMEGLLWQALESGRKSFVMLSHNFELLNSARDRPDMTMVRRFSELCRFLDNNRDSFRMRGFQGLTPNTVSTQPPVLTSPLWKTGHRMAQQALRRRHG